MVTIWLCVSLALFRMTAHPKNVSRWSVLLLSFYCLAISSYLQSVFLKDSVSLLQIIGTYLLLIVPLIAAIFFFARSYILKATGALLVPFFLMIPLSNYSSSAKERSAIFQKHFSSATDSEPTSGSCEITNEQFALLSVEQKTGALQACNAAENPALISNAIALVDHPNEALALNAVLYLQAITGEKFGANSERWQSYQKSKSSRVNRSLHAILENPNSELIDKGFSAVMVVDAFQTAQEVHKDFLTLYLQMRHGSAVTSNDLSLLGKRAGNADTKCTGESNCFRLGMNYFLLAFGETLNVAQGNSEDAQTVQRHWEDAINILEQTRQLGAPIAAATKKILNAADANHDGHLNNDELANIIRQRLKN